MTKESLDSRFRGNDIENLSHATTLAVLLHGTLNVIARRHKVPTRQSRK
nr:hypothetical protein [Rickettsia endosymbiont of Ceutorhynchus assimilis]